MNSRERLMLALNHKEPDRIPLDIGGGKSTKFTISAYEKILEYFGIDEEIQVKGDFNELYNLVHASDAVLEKVGTDVRAPLPEYFKAPGGYEKKRWEDEVGFYQIDEWGATHKMSKPLDRYYSMIKSPLQDVWEDEEMDATFKWPSVVKPTPEQIAEVKRYRAEGYPIVIPDHYGEGFLQCGPRIYGFQEWFMMMAAEEDRVKKILDKMLEKKIEHWDNMINAFGDDIDVVCECDDLGAQDGTFVSPEMFRKIIKPYWKEVFEHIRSKTNAKILLHSCGSVYDIMPDLIEIGVEAFNPVQIGAAKMDPVRLKREFGKDITFWGGGVNTQSTLPMGTPQQVKDEVKYLMDVFRKDGGFVFSTIHNLQGEVPIENVIAMLEAYRENCWY